MKVIILEGVDGTGKTTLKNYIDKQSNYKYICIDRFTGSTFVYDYYTKRYKRQKEILQLENKLPKNFYLIYCYCNLNIIKKRIKNKHDNIKITSIKKHINLYKKYLDITPTKCLKVNTNENINNTYNKIIKFLESE